MPDWVIAALSPIATILAQMVKGLIPEEHRKWLAVALPFVVAALAVGLFYYYGGDLILGAIQGFFAGAAAVGLYEAGKTVAPKLLNGNGWIRRVE